MEHVSLGRKLPFTLLKLELWRCWRERCGCYYTGHFVDQDAGYIAVPHLRPTVAIIVVIGIMQATRRILSRCRGRFLPRHLSLAFKAILESMA